MTTGTAAATTCLWQGAAESEIYPQILSEVAAGRDDLRRRTVPGRVGARRPAPDPGVRLPPRRPGELDAALIMAAALAAAVRVELRVGDEPASSWLASDDGASLLRRRAPPDRSGEDRCDDDIVPGDAGPGQSGMGCASC